MTRHRPALVSLAAAVALLGGSTGPLVAQDRASEPAGHFEQGVWVPEGNTLAEVLEQQAANKAQAEAARQQTATDAARLAAYGDARAAYEAELARLAEEEKARAAEAARTAAAHEAAMAKWRADVAACEAGEKDRCAPAAED